MEKFNVAIIGAGFAGLSCADALNARQVSSVLFEKKASLRNNIHTTGIIVQEAIREWNISPRLLKNVNAVRMHSPWLDAIEVQSPSYNFYLTDTRAILEEKLQSIRNRFCTVKMGSTITKIERQNGGFYFPEQNVYASYLVLADGANTPLSKQLGFERNTEFLAGFELEFPLETLPQQNVMNVFLHPQICRGYIGWAISGVDVVQVGLAVNRGEKLSIEEFLQHISSKFPFDKEKAIGKRAGLIPIGGTTKKPFIDNALVVGDAAGYVSPVTAGGIHTAMRYGRLGGELVANLLQKPTQREQHLSLYNRRLPHFRAKHFLKWAFDLLNCNALWFFMFKTRAIYVLSYVVFFLKKRLR